MKGRDGSREARFFKSMGKVQLLSDVVASQVAAGEVVDRPASILKELVENSLDAGATRIEIEVARGGSGMIRVRDDGSGMEREDALLSLQRHATSKIRTGEDLEKIETFGFRGEAVPSIASVSRFRMATRMREAEAGVEIFVEGGKVVEVKDSGEAPGTVVEVQNLFFNLPARKKFLRSEMTESAHLQQMFQTIALAHPEVAFTYVKEGRELYRLGVAEDMAVRVRDLLGEEWFENLYDPGEVEVGRVRVTGLLAKPTFYRGDRTGQFFYLNRRPVRDGAILRGLRGGVSGVEEGRGRHLAGILFLEMPPDRFDCNVHPAKREVRFRSPDEVSEAVAVFAGQGERGGKSAAVEGRKVEEVRREGRNEGWRQEEERVGRKEEEVLEVRGKEREKEVEPREEVVNLAVGSEEYQVSPPEEEGKHLELPLEFGEGGQRGGGEVPDFRFKGMLGKRYFLWESEDGLVLMNIRHAVERIYYGRVAKRREGVQLGQALLIPLTIKLAPKDAAWIIENAGELGNFGFGVEAFGVDVVKVDAVPAGMEGWSAEELLLRVADEVRAGMKGSARRFLRDQFALSLSVLRARRLSVTEGDAERIFEELFASDMPYTSPTGSPTLLQIGWRELERKF